MLCAKLADDTDWQYFSHKIGFDFFTFVKCLLRKQFTWNVKAHFNGKDKKDISKCCQLKFLPCTQSINPGPAEAGYALSLLTV